MPCNGVVTTRCTRPAGALGTSSMVAPFRLLHRRASSERYIESVFCLYRTVRKLSLLNRPPKLPRDSTHQSHRYYSHLSQCCCRHFDAGLWRCASRSCSMEFPQLWTFITLALSLLARFAAESLLLSCGVCLCLYRCVAFMCSVQKRRREMLGIERIWSVG